MKKVISLIIMLCIIATMLVACSDSQHADNNTGATKDSATVSEAKGSTPVLYKVSDGKNTMWLFGSIHVGYDEYYPLPSYVMDAYNSSDALAVEFDLIEFEKDMQAQATALAGLVYMDGTKISDNIDETTYNDAVKILKDNNVYSDVYDYYMPSLWSSLIDNCLYTNLKLDLENGIDKHFLNLAKKDKKEILEVESAQSQYKMLADFSPELQEVLLADTIEKYNSPDEFKEELLKLQKAWTCGDEKELAKLASVENEIAANKDLMTKQELKLVEEYADAMINDRNEFMTQYAVESLKSDKEVFICVGSAHIIGDGAMAQNLKEMGYKVERIK